MKKIIDEKLKNRLFLYKNNVIFVGYTATVILFKNPEKIAKNPCNYIDVL
jgi:hypothetical protein